MSVTRLGYIGASATDVGAWRPFASEVLGLEIGRDSSDRLLYLRADERHHRLTIHQGDIDDIAYAGWEVPNHEALEAAAASLERQGVKVVAATGAELVERRVLELVHFVCPYSGIRMELVVGHETMLDPRFRPSREVSGFRTGDLGMGHFVAYTADPEGAAAFYVRALGFGISDWQEARRVPALQSPASLDGVHLLADHAAKDPARVLRDQHARRRRQVLRRLRGAGDRQDDAGSASQ